MQGLTKHTDPSGPLSRLKEAEHALGRVAAVFGSVYRRYAESSVPTPVSREVMLRRVIPFIITLGVVALGVVAVADGFSTQPTQRDSQFAVSEHRLFPRDRGPMEISHTATPSPSLADASWRHPCGLVSRPQLVRHVIWIWFENQKPRRALGGDATSVLAVSCGSTANYFGLTHPSLPNYLAAVSGGTHDIQKNCRCQVSSASLFSQVRWRLYAEGMPTNCQLTDSFPYEAHHNVALHFMSAGCLINDVPLAEFWSDLHAARLPAFAFILPNACHNMHYTRTCPHEADWKTAVAAGNVWLKRVVQPILRSRVYRQGHTVIFIAWDEGSPIEHTGEHCLVTRSRDCRTAVIAISPSVHPGTVARATYSPYSLLRTTEHLLGAPALGGARRARGMWRAFNLAQPRRPALHTLAEAW